jgi:hypothetical protein
MNDALKRLLERGEVAVRVPSDPKPEPAWEPVTKARSTPEALAEDYAIDFILDEGWERHPLDENLFRHAERSPQYVTLAAALAIEKFGATS